MAARGSRVGLRWCDSDVECLLEIRGRRQHSVAAGHHAWWWRIYCITTWSRMFEGAIVPRPRPLGAVWPQASGGSGEGGNRAESSCSTEQANGPSVSGPQLMVIRAGCCHWFPKTIQFWFTRSGIDLIFYSILIWLGIFQLPYQFCFDAKLILT